MKVKDIVKKVLILLQNDALSTKLSTDGAEFTISENKEINLIVNSINLTQQKIATNYVNLYDTVKVTNTSDLLSYSKITSKHIFNIISVKNSIGEKLHFVAQPTGIVTNKGVIVIKYSYFPNDVTVSDNMTCFETQVNERIFVYGALSEYLFVKGNFDEAQMWEEKFNNELKQFQISKKDYANLKPRSWR